jgi:hypothetical protein
MEQISDEIFRGVIHRRIFYMAVSTAKFAAQTALPGLIIAAAWGAWAGAMHTQPGAAASTAYSQSSWIVDSVSEFITEGFDDKNTRTVVAGTILVATFPAKVGSAVGAGAGAMVGNFCMRLFEKNAPELISLAK